MTDSYAILIDGGFLRRKIGTRQRQADIHSVRSFIKRLRSHEELKFLKLYRVYYYDAPPYSGHVTNPLSRKTTDFSRSTIFHTNKNLLDQLASEPRFSVCLGELAHRGWRFSERGERKIKNNRKNTFLRGDDLRPNLIQKGVDMKIGMKIASLAFKKQVQVIVLVSSDSDLVPAAVLAREEGVQIFLARMDHGVMKSFLDHTDLDIRVE